MKEKKDSGVSSVRVILRLTKIILINEPALLIITLILGILHGASFASITVAQNFMFDKAALLATGEAEIKAVIIGLVLLAAVNVVSQVLNGVCNFLPDVLDGKLSGKLMRGVHMKAARIAPVNFENTDRLDDIDKACVGARNVLWTTFIFFSLFTFYLPYFVFMSSYFFSLKPVLALSIVIIFVPLALTQLLRAKIFTKLEDASAPVRRENNHWQECMTSREFFKETRLLGAFSFFRRKFDETLTIAHNLIIKAQLKSNLFELSMKILTTAGYAVILLLLFDALMNGEITVGAFAAVFASIGFLYSIMEEIVCRHFGELAENIGTIKNYIRFIDIPEEPDGDTDVDLSGDITLENVSFTYPKGEDAAIKNVSLTLHRGETVAIVGENGSGKSTLIRLITGLYAPDNGAVYYGKTDIRAVPRKALRTGMSAVFQKYVKYQMTLRENVAISDLTANTDDEKINAAASLAGLETDEATFPNGNETMLSREFDGVDLSGGQWQRVAITRGLFRAHDLIVLDEPTAAIDPVEETRVYKRFAEISENSTAIIVTHRLGSAKIADRIIVMKNGEAVESGSHDALMAENGEYARMYREQEKWYEDAAAV